MKVILLMSAMVVTPLMAVEQDVEKPKKNPQVVHVGGQVGKPGPVEYRENTTVFSMIFAAGGPTKFGAMQRVKLFRKGTIRVLDLTNDKEKAKWLAKPDDTIEVTQINNLGR